MVAVFRSRSPLNAAVSHEKSARSANGFSFSRLVSVMTAPGGMPLDGYEREVINELSRSIAGYYDATRVPIPLQLIADPCVKPDVLVRDLSTGSIAAGGYLVGASVAPVADLLRPWSVTAGAGISVLPVPIEKNGFGDITIPKTDTAMTAHWLANQSASITQGDPTIGKKTLSPKSGGVFTKYSRLLARQGDIADALLQREMLRTIGRLIDGAVFSGTGAAGQPLGIINTPGIYADTVAAAFDGAKALLLEAKAANQGALDSNIGFVATPDVRLLLKQRAVNATAAGSSEIWKSQRDGDAMVGRKAFVSIDAPGNTVICGPWDDVVFTMWGTPMLEINPNDPVGFRTGIFQARIVVDCDVGVLHPAAWSVVSNLT